MKVHLTPPSPRAIKVLAVLNHLGLDPEIKPLEQEDDNVRFFDHRREWARTDFEHGGVPRQDWEDLLKEMRRVGGLVGSG